jgi:spermidine/putrescine transport system permease protein
VSEGRRRRGPKFALAIPSWIWYLAFFVVPLAFIVVYSFGYKPPVNTSRSSIGLDRLSLDNYRNALEGDLFEVFVRTLRISIVGTTLCLLIAFPLAYWLAVKVPQRWRGLLLGLVIVPFWTSFLIRTYAWIFILGGKGIPALLAGFGFADIRLINTPFAVMVGIVYAYLPLMVFPIYVGLEKLDKRLLEASADLYATPLGSFLQVTLPLSAAGVVTGCMLVFILLMGEYLIPALLGGGKVFFVGNALVDLFLQSRNWPFGAACAVALVAIMLVTVTLYMRLTLKSGAMRDQSLV